MCVKGMDQRAHLLDRPLDRIDGVFLKRPVMDIVPGVFGSQGEHPDGVLQVVYNERGEPVEGFELLGFQISLFHDQVFEDERSLPGVLIADVSGKAMQAATVVMRFSELVRYELRGKSSPADVLEALDRSLEGQIPSGMFVTCGVASVDPQRRSLQYSSAGSPEVYHFVAGENVVRPLRRLASAFWMSASTDPETPTAQFALIRMSRFETNASSGENFPHTLYCKNVLM